MTDRNNIGRKPANGMTYRQWLIGMFISGGYTTTKGLTIGEYADEAVLMADNVLSKLAHEPPEERAKIGK